MINPFGLIGLEKPMRVFDRFNRADGALGSAESGQAWSSNLTITSNQVASANTGFNVATIESGLFNCIIKDTFAVVDNTAGVQQWVMFRRVDANNYWLFGYSDTTSFILQKNVAGSFTTVATVSIAHSDGDQIKIVLNGSSIKVYVNGVLKVNATDSTHQTGTRHGMVIYQTTVPRHDNFSIETGT